MSYDPNLSEDANLVLDHVNSVRGEFEPHLGKKNGNFRRSFPSGPSGTTVVVAVERGKFRVMLIDPPRTTRHR